MSNSPSVDWQQDTPKNHETIKTKVDHLLALRKDIEKNIKDGTYNTKDSLGSKGVMKTLKEDKSLAQAVRDYKKSLPKAELHAIEEKPGLRRK